MGVVEFRLGIAHVLLKLMDVHALNPKWRQKLVDKRLAVVVAHVVLVNFWQQDTMVHSIVKTKRQKFARGRGQNGLVLSAPRVTTPVETVES